MTVRRTTVAAPDRSGLLDSDVTIRWCMQRRGCKAGLGRSTLSAQRYAKRIHPNKSLEQGSADKPLTLRARQLCDWVTRVHDQAGVNLLRDGQGERNCVMPFFDQSNRGSVSDNIDTLKWVRHRIFEWPHSFRTCAPFSPAALCEQEPGTPHPSLRGVLPNPNEGEPPQLINTNL